MGRSAPPPRNRCMPSTRTGAGIGPVYLVQKLSETQLYYYDAVGW